MTILVVKRNVNDYMAYLDGHPEIWDCGTTQEEAVGNLIITHGLADIQYKYQ